MSRAAIAIAALGGALLVAGVAYVLWIPLDAGSPLVFANPSAGMAPTILAGDRFSAEKLRDDNGSLPLVRGEVVLLASPPDPSKTFVKRIAGVPGDTLAMTRGVLRRNGAAVDEPYVARDSGDDASDVADDDSFRWQRGYLADTMPGAAARYHPSRDTWGPLVVPRGQYFVLGDARHESLDSRYWGFVPRGGILGRARRIYFSRDPATGRLRLGRFGRRIL